MVYRQTEDMCSHYVAEDSDASPAHYVSSARYRSLRPHRSYLRLIPVEFIQLTYLPK